MSDIELSFNIYWNFPIDIADDDIRFIEFFIEILSPIHRITKVQIILEFDRNSSKYFSEGLLDIFAEVLKVKVSQIN